MSKSPKVKPPTEQEKNEAFGSVLLSFIPPSLRHEFADSPEGRRVRAWLDLGFHFREPRVSLACVDFISRKDAEARNAGKATP